MDAELNYSNHANQPVEPPAQRHSIARWLLLVLILIAVGVAGWKLLTPSTATSQAAAGGGFPGMGGGAGGNSTRVSTTPARKGSIEVTLDSLGTVTPERTVSVYSQVSGRVTKVYYREGQMVTAGQPLVDIDSSPFVAQLHQAQGQLERDQALLAQARIDLTHYQDALKRNAIAKQMVDDQEQLVHQYEGTVKSDQGTVEYDKIQVGYCHITAPTAGRLGLRLIDTGSLVTASSTSTLVIITQLNPMTVVFTVPQDSVPVVQGELRKGRTLRVDAYDRLQKDIISTGKLLTLDNQADTTTGTVKFRAEFNNANGALFPNQFVNARMWIKTLNDVILVPTPAIQFNSQQAFVWVLDSNSTVHVRNIQVGDSNAKETQVTGVNVNETIVTSNIDRLQEGAKVAALKPGEMDSMMGGRR
jgi:multidrug efflux system membrane fusion protein